MRFAFISSMEGSPWGGSEELWSQTALRLLEAGHDVSASVAGHPVLSTHVTDLAAKGVRLLVRPVKRRGLAWKWRKLVRFPRGFKAAERAWLGKAKPDLVIISQGGTQDGLRWMRVCRAAGLPYIAIVHICHEGSWPSDDTTRALLEVYAAAKHVFCVSRANLHVLQLQLGQRLPGSEVIWNPYRVTTGQPPAWPDNDVWKLANVARLEPQAKGQDLLIQVLARPRWRERAVEVNLYGQGPCEQNLRLLVELFQLKNIHFRGHVADVNQIWAENHALILPSRHEGLPLALVEAMWCARPAIVTDVGGNAEVCADGETGFVAAAPTVDLLDEAMERAWNQRLQGEAMGLAARARAEQMIPRDPIATFTQRLQDCARP